MRKAGTSAVTDRKEKREAMQSTQDDRRRVGEPAWRSPRMRGKCWALKAGI